ncbi:hypothetical protein RCL1_001363 [Eukaryota sp. TZLM3-RCL]
MSLSDFEIFETVGEGSYGQVFRALHRSTGQLVAIKRIRLDPSTDQSEIKGLIREVDLLSSCGDPNILSYVSAFQDDSFLHIVTEFCPYGSFADLIKTAGPLSESHIRYVLRGVVAALNLLHKRRICHRDIKAANVLLSSDFKPKLADFGVATQLNNTLSKRNTVIGSPFWMDPQVIKGFPYSESCDVWSLGITAIELAEGFPPLANEFKHPMGALLAIPMRPPPKLTNQSKWSSDFHDFLTACLQKNPAQRKTTSELMEMPFLKNIPADGSSLLQEFADSAKLSRNNSNNDLEFSSCVSTVVPSSLDVSSYGTANYCGLTVDTVCHSMDTCVFDTVKMVSTSSSSAEPKTPLFVQQLRAERAQQHRQARVAEMKKDVDKMDGNVLREYLGEMEKKRKNLEEELAEAVEIINYCRERNL